MIRCEGLVKIFRSSGLEVFALQGLDLAVSEGEMVAMVGNSGSGKSTLLNVLGGLDAPSAGVAEVAGHNLLKLTSRQRDLYRRTVTGFVWQNSALNLIPYLTARDNVLLAISRVRRPAASEADSLLELLELGHRRHALPVEISGGEQQRAAIAVALATRPKLLLADEPTGSLDTGSGSMVLTALQHVNRQLGTTVVMVTHDMEVAQTAHRIVRIRDGKISTETVRGAGEATVVDGVGRLQIPKAILAGAGIGRRAEVILRGREVIVRAPQEEEAPAG